MDPVVCRASRSFVALFMVVSVFLVNQAFAEDEPLEPDFDFVVVDTIEEPAPAPKPAPRPEKLQAPWWGESARVQPWSKAVISVVRARMRDFDAAKDVELFCPGYGQATQAERENCWLLIVSGISKFESNFKPGDSFVEPNGVSSIGLMSLSPGECPNAPSASQLKDPVKNLVCGVNKMAKLIARDRIVDGSQMAPNGKVRPPVNKYGKAPYPGAAAYWSVLRPKHKRYIPKRNKTYNLGFKPEISAFAKRYNQASK